MSRPRALTLAVQLASDSEVEVKGSRTALVLTGWLDAKNKKQKQREGPERGVE